MRVFNLSLLCKWVWRWMHQSNSLWVRILRSRYGSLRSGEESRSNDNKKSLWWRDLISTWKGDVGRVFRENLGILLGEGNVVCFWEDPWVEGDVVLRDKFCNLYDLSVQKKCKVKDMGTRRSGKWVWEFKWKRILNCIEMKEFLELWCCLCRYKMDKIEPDSILWKNSKEGSFSTKSMYNALFKEISTNGVVDSLSSKIWCKGVPSKVSSFLWKALRNRVPTRDNLIKRGIELDECDKVCIFCSHEVEDIDHLLCSCKFSYDIWRMCFGWIDIPMAGINKLRSHFVQFVSYQRGRTKRKIMNIVWQCVCWSIWKARNDAIFEGIKMDLKSIIDRIKFRSWKWIRATFSSFGGVSLHDWCNSPFVYSPSLLK